MIQTRIELKVKVIGQCSRSNMRIEFFSLLSKKVRGHGHQGQRSCLKVIAQGHQGQRSCLKVIGQGHQEQCHYQEQGQRKMSLRSRSKIKFEDQGH